MPTLFAYIDPFSGYLVYQLLVMAVTAVIIFFKKIKAFVLGLFGIKKNVTADWDSADMPTVQFEQSDFEQPDKKDKKVA